MGKNISRNPFVSLCENASLNNWCWKLYCTTCGHGVFKIAFSKLIHGEHPDDDSFWLCDRDNAGLLKENKDYPDFLRSATIAHQIQLANIVSEARLSDIKTIAKFPDWLGYIGLVIHHCSTFEARKIISDSFIPQFIDLTENGSELNNYLKKMQSDSALLSINDLSRIESGKIILDNPSRPLIFDIL